MTLNIVIVLLLGVIVFQQVFFSRQIQKLIDKLMAKSYTEYKQADKKPEKRLMVKIDESPMEDLGALTEFA